MKRDLPLLVGVLLLMGPAALIPTLVLANALFSHSGDALALLVQPIPIWAAVIGLVAFPVTVAFAELPTYYELILPQLQETWSSRWIALCAVVASRDVVCPNDSPPNTRGQGRPCRAQRFRRPLHAF